MSATTRTSSERHADHQDEVNRVRGLARVQRERDEARKALVKYADHQSWRCGHPDRYPHDPDCPCGLVGTLKALGLEALDA